MKTNKYWGKLKLLGKGVVMTGNLMFQESHNPIGPLTPYMSQDLGWSQEKARLVNLKDLRLRLVESTTWARGESHHYMKKGPIQRTRTVARFHGICRREDGKSFCIWVLLLVLLIHSQLGTDTRQISSKVKILNGKLQLKIRMHS